MRSSWSRPTQLTDTYDVAIVGGGPAGAAVAVRLASMGRSVVVFERHAVPQWRACGVFASPLVRSRLADVGMATDQIASLNREIAALTLESTRGVTCRLEYDHGHACGFDRVRLDAALLDLASAAGARVERGVVVRNIDLAGTTLDVSSVGAPDPSARTVSARVIVGADGGGSRVAHAARVVSRRNWLSRSGITFHLADTQALPEEQPMDGRFVLGEGWYVGLAPVPGGRVNVGIVVRSSALAVGAQAAVARVLDSLPASADRWQSATRTDETAVAGRLEHHTTRAAGKGWFLVGNAVGFIDPLTGEGLHRSLVTAEMCAESVDRYLADDLGAPAVYDRRVRSRFRSKDAVSLVLQVFLSRPAALDYALHRLARRAGPRGELTLVLTDQTRASRALDPRFLVALLRP
jgi:flavin-dependent dehydrogenase